MKDLTVRFVSITVLVTLLFSGIVILNDWAVGSARAAVVYHRGNISGFETWSANNTHYIDDVFNITDGNALTIDAGSIIIIDASHGGALAGSIVVKNGGTLNILGTKENPVYITANTTNPAPGDYRGIVVDNGGTANIQYTYIGNATTGIEINGGDSQVSNSRINETSHFGINFTGIGSPQFSDCIINDTGSGAIVSGGMRIESGASVTDCEVYHSADTGIFIGAGSPILGDCRVHNTTGNGMMIVGSATPVIRDCNVSDTWASNIYIDGDSRNVTITNSTLGNWTNGPAQTTIELDADASSLVNLTVLNSSFVNDTFSVTDYGNLSVQWYENVYVQNLPSNPVSGATVNLRNRTDDVVDTGATNAFGEAYWLTGTEFIYNSTGYIYDKYYRIEVSHPEYATESSALWVNGFNNTTFQLTDTAGPVFGSNWASNLTTGDNATLSINITDNIGVNKVRLDFTLNDASRSNWSVLNRSDDSWSINMTLPSDAATLEYHFWANDTTDNNATSQNYTASVLDNDVPAFGTIWNSSLSTGELAVFSANITDNIEVDDVLFDFSLNDGPRKNYTVNNRSGDSWSINYTLPANSVSIDYRFWSNDTADNWAASENTTKQVTDNDDPQFGTLWNSTLTTGDEAVFSANITDNVGLESVKLDFTINGNEHYNWSVSNQSGNSWKINVTMPVYAMTMDYYFWAKDSWNNAVITANQSYNVTDNDSPEFGAQWNSPLVTGDDTLFSANITDNIDIDTVLFDFTINGADHFNWSVTNQSGNSWEITITVPEDAHDVVYRFWANDSADNWGNSSNNTVVVGDDMEPVFGDRYHSPLTTGDLAFFSANVTDNIAVTDVKFDFTINDEFRYNWTVSNRSGNSWNIQMVIPANASSMKYYFWASDASGNWAKTGNETRTITDNDAPMYGELWYHNIEAGEEAHFSANITDNIGITEVKFNFTVNDADSYSWAVNNQSGDSWHINITVPVDAETVEYHFWVDDAKNNWARSANVTLGVGDHEVPEFGTIWASELTTGEEGFFSANITDNASLRTVMFDFTVNGASRFNWSVTNRTGDSWNITITIPANAINFEYNFWADDTSDNWNRSGNSTPAVTDNDVPVIGTIWITNLTTGDAALFSINITDNVGITSLMFDFTVNGSLRYNWTVSNHTGDSWFITITVPGSALNIEYYFWGRDAEGNWAKTVNATPDVTDNDAPAFGTIWHSSLTTGENAVFSANITENIALGLVYLDFTINNLYRFNWSVTNNTGDSWYITITIPLNATSIQFFFWANDSNGNSNQTATEDIPVTDDDSPAFGTLWHSALSTGEEAVFSANISENVAIASVWFVITVNGAVNYNMSVFNQSGESWNLTFIIPADAVTVAFHFWANDTSDNWVESVKDTQPVTDNDIPVFGAEWRSELTTGDPALFSINVTDNVALRSVWFNFSVNGGGRQNWSVINNTGSSWYITVNLSAGATGIEYYFWANDTSDNEERTGDDTYPVLDNDAPELNDLWNDTLTTGETVLFSVNVTDNIGSDTVWFEFRLSGGNWRNWTVLNNSGETWNITITIPTDATSIDFFFSANDTSDNWAGMQVTHEPITDNDVPVFGIYWRGQPSTGDQVQFSANVTDNIGLDTVKLLMSIDGGGYQNISVENKSGSSWFLTLTMPTHARGASYYFWANDTSLNWVKSTVMAVAVLDNDKPSLNNDNVNFTTGDGCDVEVLVEDNVAVESVLCYYSFNYTDGRSDDDYSSVWLERKAGQAPAQVERWGQTLNIPGDAVSLSIYLRVSDGTNTPYFYRQGMADDPSVALQDPILLSVLDDDLPVLVGKPQFNATYNTTEDIFISIQVFDNSFVLGNITIEFLELYEGIHLFRPLYPASVYIFNRTAETNMTGPVIFRINITDGAGNFQVFEDNIDFAFTVLDSIDPVIDSLDGDFEVGTSDPFTILCVAGDNIDVVSVELHMRKGIKGDWAFVEMEPAGLPEHYKRTSASLRTELGIDKSDGTYLYYYVVVSDEEGNQVLSGSVKEPYVISVFDNTGSRVNLSLTTEDFEAGTGEDFTITVGGSDNIALSNATLYIRRVGAQEWLKVLMTAQPPNRDGVAGMFAISYQRLHELFGDDISTMDGTSLEYYMEVRDAAGLPPARAPETGYYGIDFVDTIAPRLVGVVLNPSAPRTGESLNISITVSDNVDAAAGIGGNLDYNWTTSYGSTEEYNTSFRWIGGSFFLDHELDVPIESVRFGYTITIWDSRGNQETFRFDEVKVIDVISPEASSLEIDGNGEVKQVKLGRPDRLNDIKAGTPYELQLGVRDHIDETKNIEAVFEYTNISDDREYQNQTFYNRMTFRSMKAVLELPDLSQGFVFFRLIIRDSSGNEILYPASGPAYILNVSTNDGDGDEVPDDDEPQYESLNPDGSSKGFNGTSLDFQNDSTESMDTDGDGVGDNSDAFPLDPVAAMDSDGDKYPDGLLPGASLENSTMGITHLDDFPYDPAASVDTDDDGAPDGWNPGNSSADSTTGLKLDSAPDNELVKYPDETVPEEPGIIELNLIFLIILIVAVLAFIALIILLILRRSREDDETREAKKKEREEKKEQKRLEKEEQKRNKEEKKKAGAKKGKGKKGKGKKGKGKKGKDKKGKDKKKPKGKGKKKTLAKAVKGKKEPEPDEAAPEEAEEELEREPSAAEPGDYDDMEDEELDIDAMLPEELLSKEGRVSDVVDSPTSEVEPEAEPEVEPEAEPQPPWAVPEEAEEEPDELPEAPPEEEDIEAMEEPAEPEEEEEEDIEMGLLDLDLGVGDDLDLDDIEIEGLDDVEEAPSPDDSALTEDDIEIMIMGDEGLGDEDDEDDEELLGDMEKMLEEYEV